MSRRKQSSKLSVAFGRAVRHLRFESKRSQEAFAHDSGIDRAYYGLIERGGHTPTIATVWKIAEALHLSPSDLIKAVEGVYETGWAGPTGKRLAKGKRITPKTPSIHDRKQRVKGRTS